MAGEQTPKTAGTRMPGGRTSAVLIPQGGLLGQPEIPLDRPVTTVGSAENARLHLVSRTISKLHAIFVNSGGGTYVADMASRTGVLINGKLIRDGELKTGDRVQIGKFVFRFRSPSSAGPIPPQPLAPAASVIVVGAPAIHVHGRVVIIGRRDSSDVPITTDAGVSSAHTVIFQMDGRWHIRDLASRTGTNVNGKSIHQQELKFGDRITVGSATVLFQPAAAAVDILDDSAVGLTNDFSDDTEESVAPTPVVELEDLAGDADWTPAASLPEVPADEEIKPLPQADQMVEPSRAGKRIPTERFSSPDEPVEAVVDQDFGDRALPLKEVTPLSKAVDPEPAMVVAPPPTPPPSPVKIPEIPTEVVDDFAGFELADEKPSAGAALFHEATHQPTEMPESIHRAEPKVADSDGLDFDTEDLGRFAVIAEEIPAAPTKTVPASPAIPSAPIELPEVRSELPAAPVVPQPPQVEPPLQAVEPLPTVSTHAPVEAETAAPALPETDVVAEKVIEPPSPAIAQPAVDRPSLSPPPFTQDLLADVDEFVFVPTDEPVDPHALPDLIFWGDSDLDSVTEQAVTASQTATPAAADPPSSPPVPDALAAVVRPSSHHQAEPIGILTPSGPSEESVNHQAEPFEIASEISGPAIRSFQVIAATIQASAPATSVGSLDLAEPVFRSVPPAAPSEITTPTIVAEPRPAPLPPVDFRQVFPDSLPGIVAPANLDTALAEFASAATMNVGALENTGVAHISSGISAFTAVPMIEMAGAPKAVRLPEHLAFQSIDADPIANRAKVTASPAEDLSADVYPLAPSIDAIHAEVAVDPFTTVSPPESDLELASGIDLPSEDAGSWMSAAESIAALPVDHSSKHFELDLENTSDLQQATHSATAVLELPMEAEFTAAATEHSDLDASIEADVSIDHPSDLELLDFEEFAPVTDTSELEVSPEASPQASDQLPANGQSISAVAAISLEEPAIVEFTQQSASPADLDLAAVTNFAQARKVDSDAVDATIASSDTFEATNVDGPLVVEHREPTAVFEDAEFTPLADSNQLDPMSDAWPVHAPQTAPDAITATNADGPIEVEISQQSAVHDDLEFGAIADSIEADPISADSTVDVPSKNELNASAGPTTAQAAVDLDLADLIGSESISIEPPAAVSVGTDFLDLLAGDSVEPAEPVSGLIPPNIASAIPVVPGELELDFGLPNEPASNDGGEQPGLTDLGDLVADAPESIRDQTGTEPTDFSDLTSDHAPAIDSLPMVEPPATEVAAEIPIPADQAQTRAEMAPESPNLELGDLAAPTPAEPIEIAKIAIAPAMDLGTITHTPVSTDFAGVANVGVDSLLELPVESVTLADHRIAEPADETPAISNEDDLEFLDFDEPLPSAQPPPTLSSIEPGPVIAAPSSLIEAPVAEQDLPLEIPEIPAPAVEPETFAAEIPSLADQSSTPAVETPAIETPVAPQAQLQTPALPVAEPQLEPSTPVPSAPATIAESIVPAPEAPLPLNQGQAPATPVEAPPVPRRGPSLFGFDFEGGSFLGGMPISLAEKPKQPAGNPAPPPALPSPAFDLGAIVPSGFSAMLPPIPPPAAAAAVAAASLAAPLVTPKITIFPAPVIPVARSRPQRPPGLNRPDGASLTGLVTEIRRSPDGTPVIPPVARNVPGTTAENPARGLTGAPLKRGGLGSRNAEVFSQLSAPIGVEVFGGRPGDPDTFVVPDTKETTEPDGELSLSETEEVAPQTESASPQTAHAQIDARKARWSRLPIWIALMFIAPASAWALIHTFVKESTTVTGRLGFAVSIVQPPDQLHQFVERQKDLLLNDDDIRLRAMQILTQNKLPPGFTATRDLYAQYVQSQDLNWAGNSLEFQLAWPGEMMGRSQVDAVLRALAEKDSDLEVAREKARQDADTAKAAVDTLNAKIEAMTSNWRSLVAKAADMPDLESVTQSSNDMVRLTEQLKEAAASRAVAESQLADLKSQDPTKPIDPANDRRILELQKQLEPLTAQIRAAKSRDSAPDPLMGALQKQADAISASIDLRRAELAADASVPPEQRAVNLSSQIENLSVQLTTLKSKETDLETELKQTSIKADEYKTRQDAARIAAVQKEDLYHQIQDNQALKQAAGEDYAVKEAFYDSCITVGGDPKLQTGTTTDVQRTIFLAVTVLSTAVFGLLSIGEVRRPRLITSIRPAAAPLVNPTGRVIPWPQPRELEGLERPQTQTATDEVMRV